MFLQGKWPYYYYASLKTKIFRNKNSIEICFRKSNPNAIELKKNEYSWFSFFVIQLEIHLKNDTS